jgi:hypothetical protein
MALTGISAAAGQPVDSIGYPTVAAALEALKAKKGVAVSDHGGWTVVEDKAAQAYWSFTPPGHPAHPAVVKRTVISENGGASMRMTALCQAAKEPCDQLMASFQQLNERMIQALQAKGAGTASTAAGWQASSAQLQVVERNTRAYFAAKDGQRFQDAYAMLSPGMAQMRSFARWREDTEQVQAKLGAVARRDLKKITWYKDPPNAAPGTYAAVDYSSQFANADIHCGYLVWRENSEGGFSLLREEENFIDRVTERGMSADQRQQAMAQFGCKGM